MQPVGGWKLPVGEIVDHHRHAGLRACAAVQRGKRRSVAKAQQVAAAHPARQHQLFPGMAAQAPADAAAPPAGGAFHGGRAQIQIIHPCLRLAHQPQRHGKGFVCYQPVKRNRELAGHALHACDGLHQKPAVDDDFGGIAVRLDHARARYPVGKVSCSGMPLL